jgi:hypothetical protein
MKIDTIYLKPNTTFSQAFSAWAGERSYVVQDFNDKAEEADSGIDGLVIFNENQTIDKELLEIRDMFDHKQKPVHKIDINGTLMVGVSNLDLWVERNKCKRILIIGSDTLLGNPNLERYLNSIK